METLRTKILGFALLLAGLALCGAGLWLLLSPAQYQATARIKINQDMPPIHGNGQVEPGYDPYFIQTDFEVIQSEIVLSNVISTLNLSEKWGEKYNAGNPFTIDEMIRFLTQRMSINLVRNTKLFEIHFTSEDPDEAARIANAIANAYRDYRMKFNRQLATNFLQALEQSYQKDEGKIRLLQSNVDFLREKFEIPTNDFITQSQKTEVRDIHEAQPDQPYWEEKRELESEMQFDNLVAAKIKSLKSDLQNPKTSPVEIVDVAQPPKFPASPNRWLGATFLAIGLLPTAGGFLLLKSSFRRAD